MFTGGVFDPKEVTVKQSVQYVTVYGSPSALLPLEELVLEIDETTIDGSRTFEYSVGGMLPQGVTNESGVSKITVEVILPKLAVRSYTVSKENINVINLPEGSTCEIINDIEIRLIGERQAFAAIDRKLISAEVDFNRIIVAPNGTYLAIAKISLGADYPGIYIHNADYKVNFTVREAVVED